jgi:arsenate reductase
MTTVLFACTHNAGRSQMAAALFNRGADPARARAISAGTAPGPRVQPVVVAALREIGIDLSGATPLLLTSELTAGAQLLVTMGCGETCPLAPGLAVEDWALPDPKDRPLEEVRGIRDTIRARVENLLAARGWQRTTTEEPSR